MKLTLRKTTGINEQELTDSRYPTSQLTSMNIHDLVWLISCAATPPAVTSQLLPLLASKPTLLLVQQHWGNRTKNDDKSEVPHHDYLRWAAGRTTRHYVSVVLVQRRQLPHGDWSTDYFYTSGAI